MNTLKNHLSLIFALVTMLTAIQSVISLQHIIEDYETRIANEYAMIIVSKDPLEVENIPVMSYMIGSAERIDTTSILESVKGKFTERNEEMLKTALPHFYRLKLIKYPSKAELEETVRALKKNTAITRVESFAKNQNTLYSVLLLNKTVLTIFSILIFFIASLLVIRQMEVWRFRHSERMQIMAIFGAALWLRSAVLYRLAIVDSVVSTAIVSGVFFFLGTDKRIAGFLGEIGLDNIRFSFREDSVLLFTVALGISIASVLYVIVKADQEE